MIQREKAGNFWFVAVKNFDGIGIDVVRTLSIPPHYSVFQEDFNIRALTKHVDKCFYGIRRRFKELCIWRRKQRT